MTKGRLYGKNVLDGVFRAAPDEDLFLGELLVAVDEGTGRRYLFRVVDVSYGSEHREPGWFRDSGNRYASHASMVRFTYLTSGSWKCSSYWLQKSDLSFCSTCRRMR